MKKTLTAIALFTALGMSMGAANASLPLHAAGNEGLQNYYYYFGAPCCDVPGSACANPVAAAPCGNPCNPCEPCKVSVEYEQVCRTCDPCGSGVFGIFPWNW